MDRRRTRRGLVALAVSLAAHLCVLLWAFQKDASGVAPAARPTPVRLVWLDAEAQPSPSPLPSRGTPPPARPRAKLQPGVGAAPIAAPTPPPSPPDAPRAVALIPAGEGLLFTPHEGSSARGHTLHPGDLPADEERLADEQERVSTRVGNWLAGDLSAAGVRGGLPDPSYGQLGADLRAATDLVPRFIDTNSPPAVVSALLGSWGAGAERYAKTGAPYAEPEGRLENVERPSALAESVARGSPDAQATAQFLAAGARLQEFADGRAGLELYALVEVRQQPSGALESVRLLRPSGLAPFDAWVTDRARQVGLAFSFDAGTRARPLRSVWRFDGVILYRRKLKLSELDGRAALGMITMAALSALSGLGHETPSLTPGEPPRLLGPRMPGMTGRFDEMTGALDVVDLTNPTYDCRVTLLEAD